MSADDVITGLFVCSRATGAQEQKQNWKIRPKYHILFLKIATSILSAMSSKKATPRRKSKPSTIKAKAAGKEVQQNNATIASYSFVPDDEVEEIIRDVEKFSIRRNKIEDDMDSDETDDSTAVCRVSVHIVVSVVVH